MNQQDDSKIVLRAASTVAAARLGRRLSIRYSATRRPYMFQFYTRVAIARSIVTDVFKDQFADGFKTKKRA